MGESQSRAQLSDLYRKAVDILTPYILPLFIVGGIIGPHVIGAVYGPRYAKLTPLAPFILLPKLAGLISAPASTLLYAIGRQRQLLVLCAGSAVLSLVCNALMIPKLGLWGAAASVTLVQVLLSALTIRLVETRFTKPVLLTDSRLAVSLLLCWISAAAHVFWPTAALVVVTVASVVYCLNDRTLRGTFNLTAKHVLAGWR